MPTRPLWVRWGNMIGEVVEKHYRPPTSVHPEKWILLIAGHNLSDTTKNVRLYSLEFDDIDEVLQNTQYAAGTLAIPSI
jgi:hypothetical protein